MERSVQWAQRPTGGSSAADEGARGAASLRTWTEYISVKEVARHFDVDPSTIKSRIQKNNEEELELEEELEEEELEEEELEEEES